MDLSPSETALIEMLRGEVTPTFTITVSRTEDHCVISTANPQDGVVVGAGTDFDTAYLSLCGVEVPPDRPTGGEPAAWLH